MVAILRVPETEPHARTVNPYFDMLNGIGMGRIKLDGDDGAELDRHTGATLSSNNPALRIRSAAGRHQEIYHSSGSPLLFRVYDVGTLLGGPVTIEGNTLVTGSTAGTQRTLILAHTDGTNAASHAQMVIQAAAGGGDPFLTWRIGSGSTTYAAGIDNSTSGDDWVLAYNAAGNPALGTGNLLVGTSGGQWSMPLHPHAVAFRGTAQSITTGTFTNVVFTSSTVNVGSIWGGASTCTVPAGAGGTYIIAASGYWTANAVGLRYARIVIGATVYSPDSKPAVSGDITAHAICTGPLELAAGAILSFSVYQTSGGNLDFNDARLTIKKVA